MTNDCVVDPHTTLEYKVPKPFVNGVAVKPMTFSFGLFLINSLICFRVMWHSSMMRTSILGKSCLRSNV